MYVFQLVASDRFSCRGITHSDFFFLFVSTG
jgi:hypothetical protein